MCIVIYNDISRALQVLIDCEQQPCSQAFPSFSRLQHIEKWGKAWE